MYSTQVGSTRLNFACQMPLTGRVDVIYHEIIPNIIISVCSRAAQNKKIPSIPRIKILQIWAREQ